MANSPAASLTRTGLAAWNSCAFDRASACLREALCADPDFVPALLLLRGLLYYKPLLSNDVTVYALERRRDQCAKCKPLMERARDFVVSLGNENDTRLGPPEHCLRAWMSVLDGDDCNAVFEWRKAEQAAQRALQLPATAAAAAEAAEAAYELEADWQNASEPTVPQAGCAYNSLGCSYEDGFGVGKDAAQAFHYFTLAARAGNVVALRNLAGAFTNAVGVSRDRARALRYYSAAADRGNADAMTFLAIAYESGDADAGLPRDVPVALELFERAAARGDTWAMNHLGVLYEAGEIVTRDYARCAKMFQCAADAGDNSHALVNIARCYEQGRGVPHNPRLAISLYERAADAGNGWAANRLGLFALDGTEFEAKDATRAVALFRRADELGSPDGACNLGYCHAQGIGGLSADKRAAAALFAKGAYCDATAAVAASGGGATAAAAGQHLHGRSLANLAICHLDGQGMPRDTRAAVRLLWLSASTGYATAEKILLSVLTQQ
eukprot:TRINITY_DN17928_c0_g1_i1.p1 TRINITY_DN17928_c0_g1~~TRINITY_DN17928_c0_g1_i1.p1  ORF type:complete len:504 (-),score=139.32 TRINITY_DN17928_c0_g1_i1:63-1553(-)